MAQNRSHAVMSQRSEPLDSLDDFPTPMWATRALCEHILPLCPSFSAMQMTVWEPACNRGWMATPLREYFSEVIATDVFDYGYGKVMDFLSPQGGFFDCDEPSAADWIITNPPFVFAEEFLAQAKRRARCGVAILTRVNFQESVGRYNSIFKHDRPTIAAQYVERVPMVRGRMDPEATTATSYCWYIWDKAAAGRSTILEWIPPCRRVLEKPGDYKVPSPLAAGTTVFPGSQVPAIVGVMAAEAA